MKTLDNKRGMFKRLLSLAKGAMWLVRAGGLRGHLQLLEEQLTVLVNNRLSELAEPASLLQDLSGRLERGVLVNEHDRYLFFQVAKHFTPVVVSTIGPIHYFVSTSDSVIGRAVFLAGEFDGDHIRSVFRVLNSFGLSDFRAKTFIDVGANIGTILLPAVITHKFARAIAFEPEPTNYRLLQQNIIANGVQNRVKAYNLALSHTVRELLLELSSVNSGDHRVRCESAGQADDSFAESSREVICVNATTFDDMVKDGVINIGKLGLVWIDTQGHEAHVLREAQALLTAMVPVVVEYWPYGLKRAGALETMEEIIAANYTDLVDLRALEGAGQVASCLPACRIRELKAR